MTSLTPDPTSPGTEGEEMRTAIAVWLMARDECDLWEHPEQYVPHFASLFSDFRGSQHAGDCPHVDRPAPVTCMRCQCDGYLAQADAIMSGPLARLHSDLTAAREERDDAHRLRKEDRAWYDMTVSVVEEQRDNYRDDSLRLHREKMDRLDRALIAEGNLIALAKMYGEVCKELHTYRHLLEGTIDEGGEGSPVAERLEAERDELSDMLADARQQRDAAEAEALTLRERVGKLEAQLGALATPSGSHPTGGTPDGFPSRSDIDPSRRPPKPPRGGPIEDRFHNSILRGLEDALAFAEGDESRATLRTFMVQGDRVVEVPQSTPGGRPIAKVFRSALAQARQTLAEARANDERAQREDPKGLSPKDASVVGFAEAPDPVRPFRGLRKTEETKT